MHHNRLHIPAFHASLSSHRSQEMKKREKVTPLEGIVYLIEIIVYAMLAVIYFQWLITELNILGIIKDAMGNSFNLDPIMILGVGVVIYL